MRSAGCGLVWAAGFSHQIYLFDVRTRLLVRTLLEHTDAVGALLVAHVPLSPSDAVSRPQSLSRRQSSYCSGSVCFCSSFILCCTLFY